MFRGRWAKVDREEFVDEALMLLPLLVRALGKPEPDEFGEARARHIPESQISPGHIQIMITLTKGPHSVGQLAGVLGVSTPAVSQLVDRLVEHGMVERHPDQRDRRVVLVDFAPEEREVARRIVEGRRRPLARAIDQMTDEEAQGFVKGIKLIVEERRAERRGGERRSGEFG